MAKTQKKIYNYHPVTGEFVSENNAKLSPLEKDVYLLPANATFTAPPTLKEKETAVFENDSWIVKPDYRGTDVDVLGEKITIKDIGKIPDDYKPTAEQITAHQELKIQELKAYISTYRREKENGGITVNGVNVQTDSESRSNLLGAAQLNKAIDWKTPNGFVQLTSQQITALATAVGNHIQKCFSAERVVAEQFEKTPYDSKESIETAFDDAYSNS